MSVVYNPESEIAAQIERLELEARDFRRRIDQSRNDQDKSVLGKQLKEIEESIEILSARLP